MNKIKEIGQKVSDKKTAYYGLSGGEKDVKYLLSLLQETELEWSSEFPTEPGHYWFYGYRFGKVSCGHDCKKELLFVKAIKTGSGIAYVSEGNFMYKSEVEEALFQKATLPKLPKEVN